MSTTNSESEPTVTTAVAQSLSVPVSPPSKFDFSTPAAWPQWRKRFERFMAVSGQNLKSDDEKINILMYVLGEEAEEVWLQFRNPPTTYTQALAEFENHFIPRRNIIFERYKFNTRTQQPGESIENFITSLHSLAEHCQYGALKDELIRDRIVVGMLDRKTSDRLQLKSQLTLTDCIMEAKQAELQACQTKELQSFISHRDGSVAGLQAQPSRERSKASSSGIAKNRTSFQKGGNNAENHQKKCQFCGLSYHSRERCPASKSTCRTCKKQGHWAVVCRSSKVRTVQTDDSIENTNDTNNSSNNSCMNCANCSGCSNTFLGHVQINHICDSKQWNLCLEVLEINKKFNFMIDSGADITCIPVKLLSEDVLQSLSRTSKIISGPSGENLNVLGMLKATLSFSNRRFCTDIYVIEQLCKPILGRSAITGLDILQFGDGVMSQINTVQLSTEQIEKRFPKIFQSLGTFKTEMEINIKSDVQPYVQSVPRVVPIPLLQPLKEELERLQKLNIIEPVEYPTPWVSPIVIVRKNGKIRLCVDYTKLNKAVLRTHFPIGKVERILAQVRGSSHFSRLDTNSGFYQIRLKQESQHLTCFITPFGRFIFKRLPFGITCAPEFFSMLLNKILKGLDGVIFHIDDILIHAATLEKHNEILYEVMKRLQAEGITLNKQKCLFGVNSLEFLGHSISSSGISVDPERIKSIANFPEPSDKNELLRFLGMVNFSSRFIPNRSHVLEPLTALLKKNIAFSWGSAQKSSFSKIKQLLQKSPCLEYFDPTKRIIISADASSFGIGACLIQVNEQGHKKLVCYASRLLSKTEQRYAQIEREGLALTWACEKFSEYVSGIKILLETDHKPLVQVLQTKPIDELTPRLQRFRLRLMRYDYEIYYVPGKELVVADALSRKFADDKLPDDDELALETDIFVNLITTSFEVKPYFLEKIKFEQNNDSVCQTLREFIRDGWPKNKNKVSQDLKPYFQYRFEISECDGYLLRGNRLIIPNSLQEKCLSFIHQGHLGIVKCRARARSAVWWLGLSTEIENLVRNCPECVEHRINKKEPFVKEPFPERPWQKVGIDLFKLDCHWYLIVVDYFSRYFEIFKLSSLTEKVIITKLKDLFSRFGIPEVVRSDNGPQFQSEFKQFAENYDFKHVTSSPYFSQSNGCVEAAVKIVKNLLKKSDDMYLSLLAYRTTPLENGFCPSELMFNHKIRSPLPVLPKVLSQNVDTTSVSKGEERYKNKMCRNYNNRHRVKELPSLQVNDCVWVTDLKLYGKIIKKLDEPRSFLVETNTGVFRRNRWHLILARYYNFTQNNFEYHSKSNHSESPLVTQGPSKDITKPLVSRESQLDNEPAGGSVSSRLSSDFPNSESACENVQNKSVNENREDVNLRSRPARNVKKPAYLSDYITD